MDDAALHQKPILNRLRIGVDLGGTKTEAIALDEDGRELLRRRVATTKGDYAGTVRGAADLVRSLESELGLQGSVGVGIPGSLSRASGVVKNANSTWLNGKPLDRDLSESLDRPVRVQNDANCFAVSEAVDGAARGAGIVFGVILGTGVGGGLVIDGQAIDGPMGVTGEWGHNPLPAPQDDERPGPACYCDRRGCVETFLSGPGMAARYAESGGPALTAAQIAEAAEAGDPTAAAYMERYADRLARGLAGVINILDPDVIVLGGGLSRVEMLYTRLPQLLPAHVFTDRLDTRIVPPLHGDSSGVRGAAWLWPPERQGRAAATFLHGAE
ncbi:ROK family protein [Thalassobaculum sp. OXR-137]|uniref:ROK family protein n=1 Tax=Thalassobaculum sp. OXR-137 TaxID=3100173 RepID=UPI002AC9D6FA|nr:ROK family protein [Thalassobaculum sp. OXR-137]WPZ33593.1 ROK family protein [Thalassobaculum sp. OXR-137]